MLHVVVTSCPTPSSNTVCRVAWSWRTLGAGTPLCSSTSASSFLPASGAVLFFYLKIRPWQQCFSWRPCLGTFRGHWVGWGNYHCSSRCLVCWGWLSCLPLINYTCLLGYWAWIPILKETHMLHIYSCVVIYIWYVPVYFICKNVHFYI